MITKQFTPFFLFTYTIFISLFLSSCTNNKPVSPSLKNGVLDLQHWNFDKEKVLEIKGNSRFYWMKHLTLNEILDENETYCFANFSNSWNNQQNKNCSFPMEGYATYYFKIILPQKYVGKSFIIRPKHFIDYTSQLSVNEKVVSYNGDRRGIVAATNELQ